MMENETNKIIDFTVKEEYITLNKETLEKYIIYLQLDTTGWKSFEDNLKLEKDDLIVNAQNNGIFVTTKIIPSY